MNKKMCSDCDITLTKDELALSKKMLGRATIDCFCFNCLASVLDCDVADLEVKVMEFKEQGCTMFI